MTVPAEPDATFTRRAVRATLIATAILSVTWLLWTIQYALLLAFGAVLFAVFLRGVGGIVHRHTRLPMRWAVLLVLLSFLVLLGGAGIFAGNALMQELSELGAAIEQGIARAREALERTEWGRELLEQAAQGLPGAGSILSRIPFAFGMAVDLLVGLAVVLFAGIYLAVTPRVYVDGAVRLVPPAHQARARETLTATGESLWRWLMGRFVVMAIVAVVTTVGLLLIGVPLAIPLGLIAGLLEFIPFFGPVAAGLPIVLVALTVGTDTALQALLLVLIIQQVEGNVLEPLVEQNAVSVPSALIVVAAIAFTLVFGILGAVFATPLLVVAMVFIQRLYVREALGQEPAKGPLDHG
jgi:predicted PurR-regulated permease PerM